jgi:ankyrin repeat protein
LISQQGVVDEFVQALIQEGNIESILKMVELGYDINTSNVFIGMAAPLIQAVAVGNTDMVVHFISIGADPNLVWDDFSGGIDFALNEAANHKNKEIFDYLSPLTKPELRKIAEINWNSLDPV